MISTAVPNPGPMIASRVRAHALTEPRLLRGPGGTPREVETASEYRGSGGYGPLPDPLELVSLTERAGLRGRGGAAFPTAVKLAAVAGHPDPERVVIANGEEGEPGSVKDRYLLRHRPHLVLDGLLLAAHAVGARRCIVYVSDEASERAVRSALAEAGDRTVQPSMSLHRVAPTYVAGEETAAIRAISGGPAVPRAKPPRPFEHGVDDHPTLVQNVETLAALALIARDARLDRPVHETMLLTVSGGGTNPVLYEVDHASSTRKLIEHHLQGAPFTAAMMGGMFGGLSRSEVLDLPLDPAAYRACGTSLGSGSVYLIHRDTCPIAVAASALQFLAGESARQCGVCINGTGALRDVVGRFCGTGVSEADLASLERWSRTLVGRGACGLLDAACLIGSSLLRNFADLIEQHQQAGCSQPGALSGSRFAVTF